MEQFFELLDPLALDEEHERDWDLSILGEEPGALFNPWEFVSGQPVEADRERHIAVEKAGAPLDLTFDTSNVPVVTPELGRILAEAARDDVQLIPARLTTGQPMYILVATHLVDCLDHQRSSIHYYTKQHALAIGRPEYEGTPNMIARLMIDPRRTEGRRFFRIKNWSGPLIVCSAVRNALNSHGVTGVAYLPVT